MNQHRDLIGQLRERARNARMEGNATALADAWHFDAAADALASGQPQAAANHHAALQRIGTALGLPAGADLHTECVLAIKALRDAAAGHADQVQTLRIPARPGLDPITVHIDNWGIGRGRATIACYGDAWTCCWTAMGNRTLLYFLATCDADYVAGNMLTHRRHTKAERAYAVKIAAAVIEAAKLAAAPSPEVQ